MIGLIARLRVEDGQSEAFERAFAALAAKVTSSAEPGNQLYQLCKSRSEPDTYVVMELYSDQAAVDEHPKTPHFAELWPAVGACLKPGRPEFEFVDTVG